MNRRDPLGLVDGGWYNGQYGSLTPRERQILEDEALERAVRAAFPESFVDPYGEECPDGGNGQQTMLNPAQLSELGMLVSAPLTTFDNSLRGAWNAHQRFHESIRQSFAGGSGASGMEYMGGVEAISLGSSIMTGGGAAIAEGTAVGLAAGGFWVVVGGEIFWIGVDIFQGLSDRCANQ